MGTTYPRIKYITAAGAGHILWGLDAEGVLLRFDPSKQAWTKIHSSTLLVQISVTTNNLHIYGVTQHDEIWHVSFADTFSEEGYWGKLSGRLRCVSVSGDGWYVWGVNHNREIYCRQS